MNRVQEQFYTLLRAGLWGTQADPTLFSGYPDWETLSEQAARQTVSGIVAGAINHLPAEVRPPASIINKMRNVVAATIRSHALLNSTLAEALTMFAQNGIHPVLLKGQGVATNYPEPTLRMCGDIDLYIGPQAYNQACTLARQWGEEDGESTESVKHYHFRHGTVTVELHHIAEQLPLPWHNHRFQRWTQQHLHGNHLRTVSIEGTTVSLPPVNFDALYIFNHSWHHFLSGGGIGLRQLCDWVRYLHTFRHQIDRTQLEHDLRAFGLWRPWQIFAPIAVDILGLPLEEFPFYTDRYTAQAAQIMEVIEEGGNFGFFRSHHTIRPKGYLAGKLHSFRWMSSHFAQLLLVHPHETVAAWSRYTFTGMKNVLSHSKQT